MGTVAVIGTFDSKGEEFGFLIGQIKRGRCTDAEHRYRDEGTSHVPAGYFGGGGCTCRR